METHEAGFTTLRHGCTGPSAIAVPARLRPCSRSTLALSVLMLVFVAQSGSAATDPPTMVIPRVFQKWKPASEGSVPSITPEEIGKCMGSDVDVRQLYQNVVDDGTTLERESADIQLAYKAREAKRSSISTEQSELLGQQERFNARDVEIANIRKGLEQESKTLRSKAEAADFNQRAARFNRKLAAHRAELDKLNKSIDAFRGRIDAFNASLGAANAQVTAFNERIAVYSANWAKFAQLQDDYRKRCTGPRVVK